MRIPGVGIFSENADMLSMLLERLGYISTSLTVRSARKESENLAKASVPRMRVSDLDTIFRI